jgi:VanZ family protein
MSAEQQPSPPPRPLLPWVVWLALLAAWTVALLTTHPVRLGKEVLPEAALFPLGKGLHVSVYAALTALLGWLPVGPRWHWLLLGGLLLHGAATEYLQTFVEGRNGSVHDVVLDWLGVALGLAVSWRWWRRPPA